MECGCHGSRFVISTGENAAPPATDPLAVYSAAISGEDVLVEME